MNLARTCRATRKRGSPPRLAASNKCEQVPPSAGSGRVPDRASRDRRIRLADRRADRTRRLAVRTGDAGRFVLELAAEPAAGRIADLRHAERSVNSGRPCGVIRGSKRHCPGNPAKPRGIPVASDARWRVETVCAGTAMDARAGHQARPAAVHETVRARGMVNRVRPAETTGPLAMRREVTD